MRRTVRFAGFAIVVILGAAATAFFFFVASYFDAKMNTVVLKPPYVVSPAARALHAKLRIVDLHDDLLLWPRDPLARGGVGSTDVPRLIDGNVAIEILSTVSKTPRGQNYTGNSGESDMITLLAAAERRPLDNWLTGQHLLARARWTSAKLHAAAARSNGLVHLVANAVDLKRALAIRGQRPRMVIALLSIEGLHVLEGRLAAIDTLYALGFRMAGLTHFFDNEVGGSAHGMEKGGLTALGHEVVSRMESRGMIVDLAHVSPRAVDDVLTIARRPVVVSHGGVAAVCPGPRNWTDAQLQRLASNGGLIGIGYWHAAVCDATPKRIAKAIRHAVDVAGIDHVGLGSDWDGAVEAAFDATGLPLLTQALIDAGFTEGQIGQIMGENAIRLLQAGLQPLPR
ncbi:MAG TPA: membrane dipeptidase [Gemmatimonadaceae bacterium]|nr:membrane dipeptidase [Gemmatimonadaceae bacterium]